MKHDWERISYPRTGEYDLHPLGLYRRCIRCGVIQERNRIYGDYGRRGPKITGYTWFPKVPRCI